MKNLFLATTVLVFSASTAFAAPKTYQVTGPVLALTDSAITVQKGDEKWEIARNAETKLPATVKVGSKATVQYTMSAISVEDKGAASKDDAVAKKKKDMDARMDKMPEKK